ncbi:MAG: Gfo/Idh/MocA family protein [Candidatus Cyclobacteriaceae bacterium M2_1C_046]
MSRSIKWGIIGLGKIANKFAHDLLLVENAVLYAVASTSIERAKAFAKKYNSTRYYNSYEELANDPEIDIVYIATPHTFHFANTILCLKAGKAVLCEKPMGMNHWQVQTMVNEARSRSLFLMEALWSRFIPGTEKALELLNSEIIGKIEYVKADFGFLGDMDPEKRLYNRELGGGALMDVGIYPVFISLLLMGIPSKIKAVAKFTPSDVDDLCAILFDYENGKKAILEATLLANTPVEAVIYGEKGAIKMHRRFHHTEKISIIKNNSTTEIIDVPQRGFGYYHEIVEVMENLLNKDMENKKMPLKMSLDLIYTLDRIRKKIGLTYPADKDIL